MRKRKIGKYGNSWVIKLKPIDVEDFGLIKDDIVDIDDLHLMQMARCESELTQEEKDGSIELGKTTIKKKSDQESDSLEKIEGVQTGFGLEFKSVTN